MTIEAEIRGRKPVLWINPERRDGVHGGQDASTPEVLGRADFEAACANWARMQPLFAALFPDRVGSEGIASVLEGVTMELAGCEQGTAGRAFIKHDDRLAIAGSIKARGGFYEVVSHAFAAACAAGLLVPGDAYTRLLEDDVRAFLAGRRLLVASTGNLGLSVGLIGRALGFVVEVHMSRDAKAWKKARLRDAGAKVIEHASDYISAVRAAAEDAQSDPHCYFVDDEHSRSLFLGYSAAARELERQLGEQGVVVDAQHPLFVYLPCGIGGAPGGIAFGLSMLFGANVHCFFAEPVDAPCMLTQMLGGNDAPHSVYDFGLDGLTEADGLAVTQASLLVAELMQPRLAGILTVDDAQMLERVRTLAASADQRLEPSATAGLHGAALVLESAVGRAYLERVGCAQGMDRASHVIWATGGSLVPDAQFHTWLEAQPSG